VNTSLRHGPPADRRPVARRFVASNLAVSVAAMGVGVALLVYRARGGPTTGATGLLALLALAGGASLLFSLRARVCVPCGARLRLVGVRFTCRDPGPAAAALRVGDARAALRHLGPLDRGGEVGAELWHCPACRATAALRLSGAEASLTGPEATLLIDLAAPVRVEGD
jgi:hypothetical protein